LIEKALWRILFLRGGRIATAADKQACQSGARELDGALAHLIPLDTVGRLIGGELIAISQKPEPEGQPGVVVAELGADLRNSAEIV
jgi:hypothetical protein